MKTYKAYSFGLSLVFTVAALAVAACSKEKMESLFPDKPTIVREESCLDAGLPGVAYFKVTNHVERQTYRWNIDPLFGAQDTVYSDLYASKIKVNTLGNVGDFTVTAVATNSYGDSEESEPLSVNVNKDDFPYTPVGKGNILLDKYTYSFTNEIDDEAWYYSHTCQWIYNGEDITNPRDHSSADKTFSSKLLTTDTLYVTVTNDSTGCKTRKTAGLNGFE